MVTCTSCGSDVTGKKFCARCGTAVQPAETLQANAQLCPQCQGEVKPGAAFCMHCGASLRASSQGASVPPVPVMHVCPSCNTQVAGGVAFCTNCGQDLRAPSQSASAPAVLQCANCGRQNSATMRFCGGCGTPLGAVPAAQPNYGVQSQYPQYPQAQQPQYPPAQQAQYGQTPYQQSQQYGQPYAQQGGYQPQPMMGQSPMVLRCPTCMAMAPLGTPACVSCRTSLAGVVPIPANAAMQGQQGGLGGFMGQQGGLGGFMQGNGGKYAMGALGGAAAVLGGEMLLHGAENSIENRVEGDMGYGGDYNRHHHRHREEGLLGGLGELADDIGL